MGQTNSSYDVEAADLADWDSDHGWDAYDNIYSLDDGGFTNADPYNINQFIPYNWIIDGDGVIRFKMVGYGTIGGLSITDWVVQQLLDEMK
ncbi:MAG: hypothetical protein P9L99_08985 [Candidatus Lernaella stagnicola]|nr:hypothetical protein [Candidatus Lernaella stagnicola]